MFTLEDFAVKRKTTKEIIRDLTGELFSLTKGIAQVVSTQVDSPTLEILEMGLKSTNSILFGEEDSFLLYRVYLLGKRANNYRFLIMNYAHDITFYPVHFRLNESIAGEIGRSPRIRIDNENENEIFLKSVFGSLRFKSIVGGLLQISLDLK